jgi:hypothetical protein
MKFYYPFIYATHGDGRGFLKIGMSIRNHYLRWQATDDYKHVELAIPEMCAFVGWGWKKLFGGKAFDFDVMDPVVYMIITRFIGHVLPIDYSIAHWLKVLVRRNLLRNAYKTLHPKDGDRSIRSFSYRPFSVATDVEHKIFVEEMQGIILNYIEHDTRLDFNERKACRYIAEGLLKEKLPSPLVLKDKYGIPYGNQEFYLDFAKVVMRNELYKIRSSIPFLYGSEKEPFVMEDEETHELEEEDQENEGISVRDFR